MRNAERQRALAEFAGAHERNDAIALAYLSGQYTMSAIAAHSGQESLA